MIIVQNLMGTIHKYVETKDIHRNLRQKQCICHKSTWRHLTQIQSWQLYTRPNRLHVVFTADLQFYRVAVNIMWAYPEQFDNVVLRLGGMHTQMSFIESICSLMAESGLYELLNSTFAGVQKMMTGKKFPQNMRALRIVAEELLRWHSKWYPWS